MRNIPWINSDRMESDHDLISYLSMTLTQTLSPRENAGFRRIQASCPAHRQALRPKTGLPALKLVAACFCELGLLTAGETENPLHLWFPAISGKRELTFFGDALERFGGALDPVLAVVPFGRE